MQHRTQEAHVTLYLCVIVAWHEEEMWKYFHCTALLKSEAETSVFFLFFFNSLFHFLRYLKR